jgi:hypothetical protein
MTERLLVVNVGARAPPIVPGRPGERDAFLDAFVYPMGRAAFSECFGRRPVAFVGGGAARVRELLASYFEQGDVRALCEASPSEGISAWLRDAQRADFPPAADAPPGSSVKVDADAAATLHAAGGASLYFRAPPRAAAALVPAVAEALGLAPAALYYDAAQGAPRGEVEVFASRAGHTTGWHTDFQQNFTLQLRGRKAWRLLPGQVEVRRRAERGVSETNCGERSEWRAKRAAASEASGCTKRVASCGLRASE